jgi:hypothetical protein
MLPIGLLTGLRWMIDTCHLRHNQILYYHGNTNHDPAYSSRTKGSYKKLHKIRVVCGGIRNYCIFLAVPQIGEVEGFIITSYYVYCKIKV